MEKDRRKTYMSFFNPAAKLRSQLKINTNLAQLPLHTVRPFVCCHIRYFSLYTFLTFQINMLFKQILLNNFRNQLQNREFDIFLFKRTLRYVLNFCILILQFKRRIDFYVFDLMILQAVLTLLYFCSTVRPKKRNKEQKHNIYFLKLS